MLLVVLSVGLLANVLQAQNPRGSLRGTVQDPTGARIPSAKVVAQSTDSSMRREAVSEDRGEFRLDDLLPGAYRITVSAPGFASAEADVSIAVGTVREVTVTLKPTASAETVSVQLQSSSITTQPIDLVNVVHQGVVSRQDLETLPLAARSFANVAYLAPGTEPVEPSDPTKARITAVSTGGSSGLNNDLSVDGGDNSDDWIGGFLQNLSPETIQEFAVRTANEDADTGATTAGSVVITTKRGTNEWHGSGSFYDRAAALDARFPIENPAPNPKQPFSRQNYVGTLGGPIVHDKAWFFTSFEHVHENASTVYSPNSVAQFEALSQIAADGLIPGVPSIAIPPNVPIPFRDYIGSLRFDWAQSMNSQWFLRTSEDSYLTHNALVAQGALPSTGLTTHNNYWNSALSNTYTFSSTWLGTFVFDASLLHLTQTRNSALGFALAFPFSSTALTVSGFETYGDNQFATPITLFPSQRDQQKYQFRYDLGHASRDHSFKLGVNFIHEPVLAGAFPGNQETLYKFPNDPTFYAENSTNLAQFPIDYANGASPTLARDGSFSQSVQRLSLYAQDSWRLSRHLTLNYGLRWQRTFGLFNASGRNQTFNPSFSLLPSLGLPERAPHDDLKQFGPRLGLAYAPGNSGHTVIRTGFGLFYNDLAQNGWAAALQAVNGGPNPPTALIDPNYKTPYALHATGGLQHAFNSNWTASADYTHEEGNHSYRAYSFASPVAATVFRSDNRSSYNALMLHLQGNVSKRFNLVANYTFSKAQTWGCVLGELFDYVNGVCNPLNPFGPGDYGPSGEDVRHRFVLAGTVQVRGGFELSTMFQAESARPFTITTADNSQRISVNGAPTALDAFRGTPYIQMDLRVTRPFKFGKHGDARWEILPFAEFFNVFNRNNPGANYVANIAALPLLPSDIASGNATTICLDPTCSQLQPITSFKQLEIPAGGLGDFFGPGTSVGIPFAAQLGVRVNF
ncbi:MAG TPA: carboxypeptidase regulatory-like domain-containing protein [Candidatus Binatus sp.]|nr:carboxypeptidase regulatory-like domain-containing protein [Candidatus Binatus sp.]